MKLLEKEKLCPSRQLAILPANLALIVVGLLDLASTIVLLGAGRAVEMNPLMAEVLRFGLPAFVAAKLSSLALFVAVIEWYRRARDASAAQAVGRFTVAAYLSLYVLGFALANHRSILG